MQKATTETQVKNTLKFLIEAFSTSYKRAFVSMITKKVIPHEKGMCNTIISPFLNSFTESKNNKIKLLKAVDLATEIINGFSYVYVWNWSLNLSSPLLGDEPKTPTNEFGLNL